MKPAELFFFFKTKYNEGDEFCNILMPNDTFLILVKNQPIKGTVYFVYIEFEFFC